MEENKDTIKIEVKKPTLAFVILHLIVIAGWWGSILYIVEYPEVLFHQHNLAYYEGKFRPSWNDDNEDEFMNGINTVEENLEMGYRNDDIYLHHATMETATCLILTSLFTIILYLEYCRRLPKKE